MVVPTFRNLPILGMIRQGILRACSGSHINSNVHSGRLETYTNEPKPCGPNLVWTVLKDELWAAAYPQSSWRMTPESLVTVVVVQYGL